MWMGKVNGSNVPLGVTDPADRAGAEAAMARLIEEVTAAVAAKLAESNTVRPVDGIPATLAPAGTFVTSRKLEGVSPPTGPTVAEAVAAFLAAASKRSGSGKITSHALRNYEVGLGHFAARFGSVPAASLDPEDVEAWADRPAWSPSYQRTLLSMARAALKVVLVELRVRRPPAESRGAWCVLDDGQFAAVLAALGTRTDLPQLLRTLRETGARPGEVAGLTVEIVDWTHRQARLKSHKTRRKTGRDRVLVFSVAAMTVLESQRTKYGSGALFRTRAGAIYTAPAVGDRLRKLSKRLGFRVLAYGLGRHSYATAALIAGIPDAVVAALLGHTSTQMIYQNYAHVSANAKVLREAAEKASGRREAG